MDNFKLYVITHKKFDDRIIKNKKYYIPLLVGKDIGNKGKIEYLSDNTGNNISQKNGSFCELTGIYWAWKNDNADIVGFDHYRRYFVDDQRKKQPITEAQVIKTLKNNDIILPEKEKFAFLGKTAAQYFGDRHDPLIWTICRDIISQMYPDYVKDFDWYSRQTSGYSYNMAIGRKELLDQYNEWLFNILFELEKRTDLSVYSNYNTRMYGFVSERLINVWVHHNKLKVKEQPVLFIGKKNIFKNFIRRIVSIYWQKTHTIYNSKKI